MKSLFPLLLFLLCLHAFADDPAPFAGANVVILNGLPGDVEANSDSSWKRNSFLKFSRQRNPARKASAFWSIIRPASRCPRCLRRDQGGDPRKFCRPGARPGTPRESAGSLCLGTCRTSKNDPVSMARPAPDSGRISRPRRRARRRAFQVDPLFRGSGSFAKAIQSPRAEIISSENETAFASDPVASVCCCRFCATVRQPLPGARFRTRRKDSGMVRG